MATFLGIELVVVNQIDSRSTKYFKRMTSIMLRGNLHDSPKKSEGLIDIPLKGNRDDIISQVSSISSLMHEFLCS